MSITLVAPPLTHPGIQNRHYPALDGVRGLALLSVFLSHFVTMENPASVFEWGGWLGLDLFFVLSGFLITGILYNSLQKPRYFRTFYIRRALRIFPLYYAPWIVFLLLTPWLHPAWSRFDIARVFYYGNLMDFVAFHHPQIPFGAFLFHLPDGRLTGFNTGALWSLCLEEQFYLLWPPLLFWVRDRRRIMQLCVAGIVISPFLNLLLLYLARRAHTTTSFLYTATYCHYSPMLFGAWLALWLRGRPTALPVGPRRYLLLILCPCLVLALSCVYAPQNILQGYYFAALYGYSCAGLAACGVILAAVQPGPLAELLSARWLTAIGTISYGLYIIHGYLMSGFSHHADLFTRHHMGWLMPLVAFAPIYLLAWLSFRYLESPFLRLKNRLAPT